MSAYHSKADMLYNIYQEHYTKSFTQFCVLRVPVTKASQLDTKLSAVRILKQGAIYGLMISDSEMVPIKDERGSSIQDIKWGTIQCERGERRYINITLKTQKQPLIMYGKNTDMEMWYDALRRITDPVKGIPETPTSQNYIKKLEHGLELAEEKDYTPPKVPPSPTNTDFE